MTSAHFSYAQRPLDSNVTEMSPDSPLHIPLWPPTCSLTPCARESMVSDRQSMSSPEADDLTTQAYKYSWDELDMVTIEDVGVWSKEHLFLDGSSEFLYSNTQFEVMDHRHQLGDGCATATNNKLNHVDEIEVRGERKTEVWQCSHQQVYLANYVTEASKNSEPGSTTCLSTAKRRATPKYAR